MAVVYVREQGACIHKSNLQLAVQKGQHILKKVPLSYVEQLAVFGNVQITTQLMQYLLQQGIEIHYFTYGGNYLGCSKGEHSRNIFLRCAQYEIFSDMEKRMVIARTLVEGKIRNQLAVIRKYRWDASDEHSAEYNWRDDVESLEKQLKLLETKDSIEAIMGVEGNIRYGRKSLALDLIEVFRQPAADRLVLRLFNKQILTKYDFREDDMEGIYLNEDGFQKFCYEYEKWMNDKRNGDSWRMLMRRQAQMLRETIQYGTVFQTWKWE